MIILFFFLFYEQTDDIISDINEGGTMLYTALNIMGMLFHALDKFSDAIRVYERCLKTLEKDCGKLHCRLVRSEIFFGVY